MTAKKHKKSVLGHVARHIKLAIVPHRDNDYRPHLIRRYGIMAIIFIFIGLQAGYNISTTESVLGRGSTVAISSLVDGTNAVRAQDGKSQLQLNQQLNKAAYLKAKDMFANQYWAHDSPSGTGPWKWFGDVNYNYATAGENLAKNFTSSDAVITAWLASPLHRENVLNPDYQDVGFAVLDGVLDNRQTSIVVALYGSPAESATMGAQTDFNKAVFSPSSPLTQFGIAVQSLSPALLGGLLLLMFTAVVALIAHAYRTKLPKKLRLSWYRHHGAYKAIGLTAFSIAVIILSGGGEI